MPGILTFAWIVVLIILAAFALQLLTRILRRTTIHDYEVGLLYVSGKLVRTLPPGGRWIWGLNSEVRVIDLRSRVVTIPAQEVLSADNVSVKASLLLRYKIARPELTVTAAVSFEQVLYADAQLALRELVGALAIEDQVAKRDELGAALELRVRPKADALGLTLESAGIKDLIFPPLLRQAFHQVVEARHASQASLERARGEVATLRSLANAARRLENNPALVTLKTLQTVAEGKHTIVLGGGGVVLPVAIGERSGSSRTSSPSRSPDAPEASDEEME